MRIAIAAFALFSALAAASTPAPPAAFVPGGLYLCDSAGGSVIGIANPNAQPGALPPISGSGLLDAEFGPNGHLYIVRNSPAAVLEVDASGAVVNQIGDDSVIPDPRGLCIGPGGDLLVAAAGCGCVVEFSATGQVLRSVGGGSSLSTPMDVAVDVKGNIYISSYDTNSIFVFDPCGVFAREFGVGTVLDHPTKLAFGPTGELAVVSSGNHRLAHFDIYGNLIDSFDAGPTPVAAFGFTADQRLVVAYAGVNTLAFITLDGQISNGVVLPQGAQVSALCFAPFRFQTTFTGTYSKNGQATVKINEKPTLTYFPSSHASFLTFTDDPSKPFDMVSLLNRSVYAFHGNEIIEGSDLGGRTFFGSQISWPARADGLSNVILNFTAKVDADSGVISNPKAKGTFQRATAASLLLATFTTSKLLK